MKDYRDALEQLAAMLRMHSQLSSHLRNESGKEKFFRRICEQQAVGIQQQIDLIDAARTEV
ncbi:MAG: hypothetical protein LWW87_08550 [Geobacteraceae bacterium]|nr:hypothetical protein [Geobacteraceae bacterium]